MTENYLVQAVEQALKGDLQIGAVVTDDKGRVIGRGYNKIFSETHLRHAEIGALEEAGREARVLYSTLKPCWMCQGAALNSGVHTIVYGERDVNITGVLKGLTEIGGVLYKECRALNIPQRFRSNIQYVPFVRGSNPFSDMNGVYVAGSYARWCAGLGEEYSDMDVFLHKFANKEEVHSRAETLNGVHIHDGIGDPYWSHESLIETFPLSLQAAALIGEERIMVRSELLEDASMGMFRVMNETPALKRNIRNYETKGYQLCTSN